MEEISINSLEELLHHLDLQDELSMFRGQADVTWPLLPTIARMGSQLTGYENWAVFEDDLIERFQKCALPFLDSKPTKKVEWLVVAQHHGLPTRLLDWSTNPLKGLFFAVENPNSNADGVLWQFEPKSWWNGADIEKTGDMIDVISILAAYFPNHLSSRVIAQESCFTVFPLPIMQDAMPPLSNEDAYKKHVSRIKKIIVPATSKQTIRKALRKLGISHQSMYPGLDGLSTSIRREFELEW